MSFLRTATTGRLLTALGAVVAAIIAGAAVAVAATSGGTVPKRQPLASAVHQALKAPAVSGITARVSFTNNLIDSAEIQGSDPLLKGGTGRLWISSAKHELRLEVQGENGDAPVVVRNGSFWAYDPSSRTVYRGTLPAQSASSDAQHSKRHDGIPSLAQVQSALNRIARRTQLSGAIPGDIAGRPAYTVRVSPTQSGGLLGAVELGWDAVRGVPLRFEVLARGDSTPVLELTATNVSFGNVPASTFTISPPSGAKVVHVSAPSSAAAERHGARSGAKHHEVTGVAAVSHALPFKLAAPSSVGGLHRNSVALLHGGWHPVALVSYGQGLGGVAVLEQASARSSGLAPGRSGGGDGQGLSIPTVSINGVSGQELDTALGTVVEFSTGGVSYTVIGSVPPVAAEAAARSIG